MTFNNYDTILLNLKIIAQIEKGVKLTTKDGVLAVESYGMVPEFVRRWIYSDSRQKTIDKIKNTMDTACEQLKHLRVSEEPKREYYEIKIAKELFKCRKGLDNLKVTYHGDSSMVAKLDLIIDQIKFYSEKSESELESEGM